MRCEAFLQLLCLCETAESVLFKSILHGHRGRGTSGGLPRVGRLLRPGDGRTGVFLSLRSAWLRNRKLGLESHILLKPSALTFSVCDPGVSEGSESGL